MNAKLIINNIEIKLGHRQLEEIVFSINDEPALREVGDDVDPEEEDE